MDSSLPVDIKLSSLLEWLQSRRHIKQDWAQKVKDIRAKIAAAIQDMPESEEIKNLLSNTYINYFHCVKIVKILKETEKDTQNFFGYYSSQRMKDWQAIVSLYQKDKVYVAEAAHYLNQLVKYDIPALKRDLNGIEKKISEKEDKEKSHQRMVGECARLYKEELTRRELKGENLRAELIHKTKFIPQHAQELSEMVVGLKDATEVYLSARKDVVGSDSDDVLPLLRFVQELGPSATVYEFKYKICPTSIQRPDYEHLCQVTENVNEDEDQIDFGDMDDGGYGISTEDGGEIDFGDEVGTVEVIADQDGVSSGIAVGDEALTLLENKNTRSVCKMELLELLAFLKSLKADESREHPADMLLTGYSTGSHGKPATKDLEAWIALINSILADFAKPDKAILFEIFHSPNAMATLVEQLEAMKAKIGFHEKSAILVHKDADEQRDAFAKRIVDVKSVVAKAKELERQLGKDMTQFTQGRPVNFMGGVKSVDALFSAYNL